MIKWDSFQECKDGSTATNQSMWYTILTKWGIKIYMTYINSIDSEKAFDKIQLSFLIKTQQTWYRGNVPQHNKGLHEKPIELTS